MYEQPLNVPTKHIVNKKSLNQIKKEEEVNTLKKIWKKIIKNYLNLNKDIYLIEINAKFVFVVVAIFYFITINYSGDRGCENSNRNNRVKIDKNCDRIIKYRRISDHFSHCS